MKSGSLTKGHGVETLIKRFFSESCVIVSLASHSLFALISWGILYSYFFWNLGFKWEDYSWFWNL